MSYFGLSHPIIAKHNPETGTYSDALKCGKAINTSVTPNYNEASLFADNGEDENVKEFKNASVDLGVNTLPKKAGEIIFGHKIAEDGTETSNTDDSGSYVGYGFIVAEIISGTKKYRACLLTKVKFKEGAESYQTKGDSIVFTTPTLSGEASGNKDKVWRIKSPAFDTERECDEWILEQMGLKDQIETLYAQAGMKLVGIKKTDDGEEETAQKNVANTETTKTVAKKAATAEETDTQTSDK